MEVKETCSIWVGNLGPKPTRKDLIDEFGGFPSFLSARVIYKEQDGRWVSCGFGFVEFNSSKDREEALGLYIKRYGRVWKLRYADRELYRVNGSQACNIM